MKVLLDIKDDKADSLMDVLKSLPYVKAEQISLSKAQFLNALKQAVQEVTLAKKGKIKLQSAKDFLNEI